MSFSTTERPLLPKSYKLGQGPKFADLQLECISHKNAEFTLQTNEVEIKLRSPLQLKKTTQLIQIMGPSEEQILEDNVWMEKDGDIYSFILTFPNPGWYKFEIYALPASNENTVLPGVFNYLIHVMKAPKTVLPFPKQFSPWKIGCRLFTPLTIDPSHLDNLHFKVLAPRAKLVAIVINDVFTHLEKTGGDIWEAHVNLDAHRNSSFKLNLCACLDESETTVYSTLLQYSIDVAGAPNTMQAQRPTLPSGFVLGKGTRFSEMHLECISHHSPEFTLQTNEVEITFRYQFPLKRSATLSEVNGKDEVALEADKFWIESESNIMKFFINFPKVGWYKLEIFALPLNDENTFLPMVYSYLIYVEATPKPVISYPRQYASWNDECHLYSPLTLNPSNLRAVPFKVKVPNARNVAVVVEAFWKMLVRANGDIWEGSVSLDKPNLKTITLSANMMNDDETTYKSLLQFIVPPPSGLTGFQKSAAAASSSSR